MLFWKAISNLNSIIQEFLIFRHRCRRIIFRIEQDRNIFWETNCFDMLCNGSHVHMLGLNCLRGEFRFPIEIRHKDVRPELHRYVCAEHLSFFTLKLSQRFHHKCHLIHLGSIPFLIAPLLEEEVVSGMMHLLNLSQHKHLCLFRKK